MAAVLLACLLGGILLASVAWMMWPPQSPAAPVRVHLKAPSELRVETGREVTFRVELERENYDEPIQLIIDQPSPSGTVMEAVVPRGENSVEVTLPRDSTATLGKKRVQLRTADETLEGRAFVDLTILYLPPDFEAVDTQTQEDVNGIPYYKRIRRRLGDKEQIDFVLILRERKTGPDSLRDPSTFYIGSNKVSRGQFRAFAALDAKNVADKRWLTKHPVDNDRMPIRDVTVTDAHAFARWLGGQLPLPKQWDKAAGLDSASRGRESPGEGPFKGRWGKPPRPRIAVGNLLQPFPLDALEDQDDESVYQCRGMAGNGVEWTRKTANNKDVPLEKVWGIPGENVILRGWSFKNKMPLTFEELERQDRESDYLTEMYKETADDLSFRVVLEPNR